MLPVLTVRIRLPLSQDGVPIHRVRTHSLSRVQDSYLHQPSERLRVVWVCAVKGCLMSGFPVLACRVWVGSVLCDAVLSGTVRQ